MNGSHCSAIPLVDCHQHLSSPDSLDDSIHFIQTAQEYGIQRILLNGTRPDDWPLVISVARKCHIQAAIGLHPFYASQWNETTLTLLQNTLPHCHALGEIGLDALAFPDTMPAQILAFTEQLRLAHSLNLPVCLHLRKAWQPFWSIIEQLHITRLNGYCHNFTASPEIARLLLKLGLHLSFNKPIIAPNAKNTILSAQIIPLDNILTETDSPDMASPEQILHITSKLAGIKKWPLLNMAEAIIHNYDKLFL